MAAFKVCINKVVGDRRLPCISPCLGRSEHPERQNTKLESWHLHFDDWVRNSQVDLTASTDVFTRCGAVLTGWRILLRKNGTHKERRRLTDQGGDGESHDRQGRPRPPPETRHRSRLLFNEKARCISSQNYAFCPPASFQSFLHRFISNFSNFESNYLGSWWDQHRFRFLQNHGRSSRFAMLSRAKHLSQPGTQFQSRESLQNYV